eukprot:m.16813 g.16813  ORF g.16813 m.16813 type:complete len:146 (+) comp10613_c0_seq3:124-561(+)
MSVRQARTAEPSVLDLYELGKKLGEGAFGAVRVATHRILNEEVAIKCVDIHKLDTEYEHQALEREIDILKRLNHPCCLKLYEVIKKNHYVYFVTENASTDLLSLIVEQGPLNEAKVLVVCAYYKRHLSPTTILTPCHRLVGTLAI